MPFPLLLIFDLVQRFLRFETKDVVFLFEICSLLILKILLFLESAEVTSDNNLSLLFISTFFTHSIINSVCDYIISCLNTN